jgi:hypothetical protein
MILIGAGSLVAQAKREWSAVPTTLGPEERREWAVVTIGLRWLVAGVLIGLVSLGVYASDAPRAVGAVLLGAACGCLIVAMAYTWFAKRATTGDQESP